MNNRKPRPFTATIQTISGPSQGQAAGSAPGMFRQARRHEVVSQLPGHFLIRLRQRHVSESPLNRQRKFLRFVTES